MSDRDRPEELEPTTSTDDVDDAREEQQAAFTPNRRRTLKAFSGLGMGAIAHSRLAAADSRQSAETPDTPARFEEIELLRPKPVDGAVVQDAVEATALAEPAKKALDAAVETGTYKTSSGLPSQLVRNRHVRYEGDSYALEVVAIDVPVR